MRSQSSDSFFSQSKGKDSIASKKLTHTLIPFKKANDEKFKKNAVKLLRKPEFDGANSINFKPYKYGRRPLQFGKIFS